MFIKHYQDNFRYEIKNSSKTDLDDYEESDDFMIIRGENDQWL